MAASKWRRRNGGVEMMRTDIKRTYFNQIFDVNIIFILHSMENRNVTYF